MSLVIHQIHIDKSSSSSFLYRPYCETSNPGPSRNRKLGQKSRNLLGQYFNVTSYLLYVTFHKILKIFWSETSSVRNWTFAVSLCHIIYPAIFHNPNLNQLDGESVNLSWRLTISNSSFIIWLLYSSTVPFATGVDFRIE